MSRSVQCSCGAGVDVPSEAGARIRCPRCGQSVFLDPGEAPAASMRTPSDEPIRPLAPRIPYYPLYLLLAGGLAVILGLVVIVRRFSLPISQRGPLEVSGKPRPRVPVTLPPRTPAKPGRIPGGSPWAGPPQLAGPQQLAADIARYPGLVARVNFEGIQYSLALHRDDPELRDGLRDGLVRDEAELEALSARLAGRPELSAPSEHFAPGDVLVGLGEARLDPAEPRRFALALEEWLARAQPGALVLARVRRGDAERVLSFWFPEIPTDLPRAPEAAAILGALPEPVLAAAQSALADQPPYFRAAIPEEDVLRARELFARRTGVPGDLEFLRDHILAPCAAARCEQEEFRIRSARLLQSLASEPGPDRVTLRDGRVLERCLVQDAPEGLRLRGPAGILQLPRAQVLKVASGGDRSSDFLRRFEASRNRPADLEALLPWCRQERESRGLELCAVRLLELDPGNEKGWAALGAPLAAPEPLGRERDVIRRNDGTLLEGLIIGETPEEVRIDLLVRGASGQPLRSAQVKVPRSQISGIERMGDAARRKTAELDSAVALEWSAREKSLDAIPLAPELISENPGFRVPGALFELHSTRSPGGVREAALLLEAFSAACRKLSPLPGSSFRPIPVYLLATRAEAERFGAGPLSPSSPQAAFLPSSGVIVAWAGISAEDEALLLDLIGSSVREIERLRQQVTTQEEESAARFQALRRELEDRGRDRRAPAADPSAAVPTRPDLLSALRLQERGALEQLALARAYAHASIRGHERLIRHYRSVLAGRTRRMFQGLFHEAFHAFGAALRKGFPGAALPGGLEEGLASAFERFAWEGGSVSMLEAHPGLLGVLREEQRNRGLPSPDLVLTADNGDLAHSPGTPPGDSPAAEAWALAQFLLARGLSRDRLERYAADLAGGKTAAAAFERLAGRPMPELSGEWRAYVESLR